MKKLRTYKGGKAVQISHNMFDGGTVQFKGKSHEQGGIDMSYAGNLVEVEGEETAIQDSEGDLHIMGNMRIPGANEKFKDVSKAIGKQEKKYGKILDKGINLVTNTPSRNKFDVLKQRTGQIMMEGATQGMLDLTTKKNSLAQLQTAMLETAAEMKVDAIALSEGKIKKARKVDGKAPEGARLRDDDFIKDMKARLGGAESSGRYFVAANDPNSTAYGKYQFVKDTRRGVWSKYYKSKYKTFEDFDKAFKSSAELQEDVMSDYLTDLTKTYGRDLEAISLVHRVGPGDYARIKKNPELLNKKINEINPQSGDTETPAQYLAKIKKGGIGRASSAPPLVQEENIPIPSVIPSAPPKTFWSIPKAGLQFSNPDMSIKQSVNEQDVNAPEDVITWKTQTTKPKAFQSPLDLMQVMPELLAIADNQVEPVPTQKYQPQLYQPYEQSLQDRRNANTSTFNAIIRAQGANPNIIGAAAAQKYEADAAANAEEFRINQTLNNQVMNQNTQLLNDAQLKNLQLADTQMVRQSQAKSNTKAQLHTALSSIADKYIQNKRDNLSLTFQQELFNYRPVVDENGQITGLEYQGPEALFGRGGTNGKQPLAPNQSVLETTTPKGKRTTVATPSVIKTQKEQIGLMNMLRNLF